MARGGVRDVPGKRRRVARIGYLGSRATKQSQEDEVDANTSSWVTEAVAHARALLGDRTPPQGVPEAAALLTSILLCLPELWEELAQDTLLAFGNVIAGGDASGCQEPRWRSSLCGWKTRPLSQNQAVTALQCSFSGLQGERWFSRFGIILVSEVCFVALLAGGGASRRGSLHGCLPDA